MITRVGRGRTELLVVEHRPSQGADKASEAARGPSGEDADLLLDGLALVQQRIKSGSELAEFVYFSQPTPRVLLSSLSALDAALAVVAPFVYVSPQPLLVAPSAWALLPVAEGSQAGSCASETREEVRAMGGPLFVTPRCVDSDATLTDSHRARHIGLGGGHHR